MVSAEITAEKIGLSWHYFDNKGNRLHSLEYDEQTQRIRVHPLVVVNPTNVAWIDCHDPENGDPCTLRGNVIDIDRHRLTVTEPNGTRWVWILEPATWRGQEGYYIGRWPD